MSTGLLGFLLALLHGLMVLAYGLFGGYRPIWIIGLVTLVLLGATVAAAC